jgi:glycolate oxidase FAD binding subunit
MTATTCTIDGFGPLPLVRAESVAALGELIREAAAKNTALYPVGGQTQLALGNPPSKPGHAVDMRGLAEVIDFPARDMTITVQAGITIRSLNELLAKENLRLPIDVPLADQATLGGIIATNVSGPRRYGFGTLRDYVIGISALNDEGREFKAGGRVVKNVAGYDLCKLLVGSLGTLGIITQVTLKLRPLAEHQALLCLACESAQLEAMLTRLHESRTRPVCLDLLNQLAAHSIGTQAKSPWTILVGYEGNFDAVSWQVQQLVKEVANHCQVSGHIDATAQSTWDALVELARPAHVGFKANLLPSATSAFCLAADQASVRPTLRAHAGNGIVFGQWTDLKREQADTALRGWQQLARSVIVTSCPSEWKASLDVWGPPAKDTWLMHEIKRQFDPKDVFNPGRFVAGI